MSKELVCDRCGKTFNKEPEMLEVTTKTGRKLYGVVVEGCEDQYDARKEYAYEFRECMELCDTCQGELKNFLMACNPPKRTAKACPFCGHYPYVYAKEGTKNPSWFRGIATCEYCDYVYSFGCEQPTIDKALEEVIDRWNRREGNKK